MKMSAINTHVKLKGEWKDVQFNQNLIKDDEMKNIVAFQVLKEYELLKQPGTSYSSQKKHKASDDDSKIPDKKNKRRKKKQKPQTNEEVDNSTKEVSKKNNVKLNKSDTVAKTKSEACDDEEKNDKKKRKNKRRKQSNQENNSGPTLKKESVKLKKKGVGKMVRGEVVEVTNEEEEENESGSSTLKRKSSDTMLESLPPKKKKADLENEVVDNLTHEASATKGMDAWSDLFVPQPVLKSLFEQGFTTPMPIQVLTLPSAIRDRKDIIGAAETGSGKTLAFGIPLIHQILKEKNWRDDQDVKSISPANDHVISDEDSELEFEEIHNECNDDSSMSSLNSKSDESSNGDDQEFDLPPVEEELEELGDNEFGCVSVKNDIDFDWLDPNDSKSIVSNSSKATHHKKPLLGLVLTPTRELAIQVKNHIVAAAKFTGIQVAVVVGGMAQQKQERILKKQPEILIATPGRLWELIQEGNDHLSTIAGVKCLVIDEADRMVEKGHFQEVKQLLALLNENEKNKRKRQNFIFSATLTMVHSGPERSLKKRKKKITSEEKLESLSSLVGIEQKPKIVDLTKKEAVAESLTEARISCKKEEKDLYLYYLVQHYPGRTLVFCNSKDCVRRLISVFNLLQTKPLPLHADMHQKQRLKNLDRFRDQNNALLIATDVAARGLDIKGVQHVIHYQVPHTAENYVHRSGRTARAYKEGLSVMLVSPDDMKNYRKISKTLQRDEVPAFPVDSRYLPGLKARVQLAQQIDKEEHRLEKLQYQNSWFERAAKDMDMILDEDRLIEDLGDQSHKTNQRRELQEQRQNLKVLLKLPIISKSFSGSYLTRTGALANPYMEDQDVEKAVKAVNSEKKQLPIYQKIIQGQRVKDSKAKQAALQKKKNKSRLKNKRKK